jgi:hypothetical protein
MAAALLSKLLTRDDMTASLNNVLAQFWVQLKNKGGANKANRCLLALFTFSMRKLAFPSYNRFVLMAQHYKPGPMLYVLVHIWLLFSRFRVFRDGHHAPLRSSGH